MGGIFEVDEVGIVEQATPVGSMMMWMGSTDPDGWFILNGSSFDIIDNPKLHAYLTSNFPDYSSGTLPDYRGHFPGGHGALGMSSDMGGKTSATTGDPGVSVASNGSHSHTATTTATTTVTIGGGGTVNTSTDTGHTHDMGFHKNKDNNSSNSGDNVNLLTQYHNNGGPTTRTTETAGSHNHSVDLSNISATGSTTATTSLQNAGSHSHSLNGWDTRTMPNAFAINFMIKHD
jgi:microcystin-dependent protein